MQGQIEKLVDPSSPQSFKQLCRDKKREYMRSLNRGTHPAPSNSADDVMDP
jgi:hypothetical protein